MFWYLTTSFQHIRITISPHGVHQLVCHVVAPWLLGRLGSTAASPRRAWGTLSLLYRVLALKRIMLQMGWFAILVITMLQAAG